MNSVCLLIKFSTLCAHLGLECQVHGSCSGHIPHSHQHPLPSARRLLPRDSSCSLSTRVGHVASLTVCLSAEVTFNVNISSKTFHFPTHNTFPDFRDLLFLFPYPFLLLFRSAVKILVSLSSQWSLVQRQKKVTIQYFFFLLIPLIWSFSPE